MLELSQPLSVYSILSRSFSFPLSLARSRVFYLSPSFRHSRNLHRALATLRFFDVAISFLSHSPDALPLLSLFFILSGEFLIIESRRDRERLARTWKIVTLFSPEFSQLYLICVPLATPRSFYRTVDFDGFIRTLYSQSLYSRDLKSLIMGATSARARAHGGPAPLGERIMKRETRLCGAAKRGRAGGREGRTAINVRQSVRRAGD